MYPYRRNRRGLHVFVSILLVLLIVAGAGLANYLRPLPQGTATTAPLTSEVNAVNLTWPANSQVALGATGYGVLAIHGPQSPLPIASLAKIITAQALLQKKPLKLGEQGPMLTLTDRDVTLYNTYLSEQGAVAKVEVGEQISEYQMLQAMLLPSANNMADSAAIWAFGSMDNYLAYANAMVRKQGLTHTTVAGDASGFSPKTTSTTEDLVRLGERATENPVLAEIITQREATIPVAGAIKNVTALLNDNDVTGIKTGTSDQAHGCYLFSSKLTIGGQTVTIVGATLGANDLRAATSGAQQLIASAKSNFVIETPITAGQSFGTYHTAWGAQATMAARTNVTIIAWKGAPLSPHIELRRVRGSRDKGAEIGTVVVSSKDYHGSTTLELQQPLPGPSVRWRLLRL